MKKTIKKYSFDLETEAGFEEIFSCEAESLIDAIEKMAAEESLSPSIADDGELTYSTPERRSIPISEDYITIWSFLHVMYALKLGWGDMDCYLIQALNFLERGTTVEVIMKSEVSYYWHSFVRKISRGLMKVGLKGIEYADEFAQDGFRCCEMHEGKDVSLLNQEES